MDLHEWRSKLLNKLFKQRHQSAIVIAYLLQTEAEIDIIEIPRLCLEVGIPRTKIIRIGMRFANSRKDDFRFGAAFRKCFSGMHYNEIKRTFTKHITCPHRRKAAIQGAAAWENM